MFRPLVIALAILFALLVGAAAAEDPQPGAPTPREVKSDHFLLVRLNARQIRESMLYADAKRAFTDVGGSREWDMLWEYMGQGLRFGIAPNEIDTLTYCEPEGAGSNAASIMIIKGSKPINKTGAFGIGIRPEIKPDTRGFYNTHFGWVHFPDDKTAVLLNRGLVDRYLDGYAKNPNGWPYNEELTRTASQHSFFAVFRPSQFPAKDRGAYPYRHFLSLLAARGITFTVDLKDKVVLVNARAEFADGIAAAKGLHHTHGFIASACDWVEATKTFCDVEILNGFQPALRIAEKSLALAKVEVKGSEVIASGVFNADFDLKPPAASAVKYLREILPRNIARSRFEMIGVGLHAYHSANNESLVHGLVADGKPLRGEDNEKPLLSWRVGILPHLGEDELYKQFKLKEPWDSENNKKLIEKMPEVFAPAGKPGKPGYTHMQMVIGPGAMRPGVHNLGNIPDGTSNTVALVEAAEPVIWTKPDDVMFPEREFPKDFRKKFGGQFKGGFYVAMWDGSTRFVKDSVSDNTLRNALCPDDGNPLGRDW